MITDEVMKPHISSAKKVTMSDTPISFEPVSGAVSPRFAGVPPFQTLPNIALHHTDIAKVELGLDGVTSYAGKPNRHSATHGPRQITHLQTI